MQRAGNHIAPCLGNDHVTVIDVGPASGDGGAVPGQADAGGGRAVPASVAVVFGEVCGIGAALGVPVLHGLDPEAGAVHKQGRDQDGADKDGNADPVKMSVR